MENPLSFLNIFFEYNFTSINKNPRKMLLGCCLAHKQTLSQYQTRWCFMMERKFFPFSIYHRAQQKILCERNDSQIQSRTKFVVFFHFLLYFLGKTYICRKWEKSHSNENYLCTEFLGVVANCWTAYWNLIRFFKFHIGFCANFDRQILIGFSGYFPIRFFIV